MRKRTLAGFVALAALALACSSDPDVQENPNGEGGTPAAATTPAPPKAVAVGKTLTVKTNGITADWTVTTARAADRDQFDLEPTTGGKWISIHVKAAVKEGSETYVCSCDFSIIAKSGKVYEQAFAQFKGQPDLTAATVAAGQNADGWITFDVAADDLAGARVQLKQQSIMSDTAFGYWTLDLKK